MKPSPSSAARSASRTEWFFFAAVAVLGLYLCYRGGRLPSGSFILLFGATWGVCLAAVFLFPRRLGFRSSAALILGLALVYRGLLLPHPGSAMAVKAAVTVLDLGTLALLLLVLERRRLDPRWALLYALNPVVLYRFAGQGHLDAIQVFLLMGAVALYQRRRWTWMFLFAGLAFQAQAVSLIAWPFLMRRENLRHAWIAVAAAVVPVLDLLPSDALALVASFGHGPAFNGPVHGLLQVPLGGIEPASWACLALFVPVWLIGGWWFHPARRGSPYPDPAAGLFFAVGAFLLLAPTVHLGTLSWIVPWLAVRPTASWTVLCGTVAFSFAGSGIPETLAVWGVPVLLLLLVDLRLAVSRIRNGFSWSPPEDVSVVIPTRNEADRIGASIAAIRTDSKVKEILVVDGGSDDGTPAAAAAGGARVIEHAAPFDAGGGRGGQILAGCRQVTGDVVAIVHADTQVAPGSFSRILEMLARNPDVAGGAVGSVFDVRGAKLRILEMANNFRAAVLGISFGDQVQFFRRRPVMEKNLFPNIPLMEDVELSLRLLRLGRGSFLWGENMVSARRWRLGSLARTVLVLRLVAEYLLRRLVGRHDTVAMYRRYYGGPG
ncbi:MAG: glycosyltransferase [bacterium]|nr:glycosyltransferase [bacterium]